MVDLHIVIVIPDLASLDNGVPLSVSIHIHPTKMRALLPARGDLPRVIRNSLGTDRIRLRNLGRNSGLLNALVEEIRGRNALIWGAFLGLTRRTFGKRRSTWRTLGNNRNLRGHPLRHIRHDSWCRDLVFLRGSGVGICQRTLR